jgi:murein DD-endopeptidase MepM/ murein hydrolase activator NlpD
MTRCIYAHLSKVKVRRGQEIEMGEMIGKVGNTGNSTGAHLHYEVRTGNNKTGEGYKYGDDTDPAPYLLDSEVSLGLTAWKEPDAKPKPTKSATSKKPRRSGGSSSK